MHRDIKPSNVLVNSKGQIKLCDFGVSSELVNSVADTFVGTGTYMAPERIRGNAYTVKSDVWSVGLTLMELAIGKFPFHSGSGEADDDGSDDEAPGPQGILDLLQQIVNDPSPKLPKSDAFPSILEDVIDKCLKKDPNERPTPRELYDSDPFLQAAKRTPVDLQAWAVSMMERHNRKSHLTLSQMSPATKNILRNYDSSNSSRPTPVTSATPSTVPTPTSGDIPISNVIPRRGSRPIYPARTSSAGQITPQTMNMPIRPAPPAASSRVGSAREDTRDQRRPSVARAGYSDSRLGSSGIGAPTMSADERGAPRYDRPTGFYPAS